MAYPAPYASVPIDDQTNSFPTEDSTTSVPTEQTHFRGGQPARTGQKYRGDQLFPAQVRIQKPEDQDQQQEQEKEQAQQNLGQYRQPGRGGNL
ncbi:MAG: hypothetical protein EZS28_014786 [Streblomastix strix]|uniref:Uncharacterized protein n=1 Tax=Streblomastix strix TaxID=222440 RepID=A0A5J4W5I0_9EUKA|nr:MAG: hypothetical protein EZS28_014786 [Streblomastix strix]